MAGRAWAALSLAALLSLVSGAEPELQVKVQGGKPAIAGRFSYAAMVFSEDTGLGYAAPMCGGFRIAKAAVLTSATCVFDFASNNPGAARSNFVGGTGGLSERLRVTLGSRPYGSIDPAEEDWFDRGLPVRKVVVHPDYDTDGYFDRPMDNDVAILYLKYAPNIDSSYPIVNTTQVANSDNWFSLNRTLSTIGWGYTNDKGATAQGLRYADVKRQPDEFCSNPVVSHGYNFNRELMFCAGARNQKKGACIGDEGTPIIYNSGSSAQAANTPGALPAQQRPLDVAVGITSWGPTVSPTTPGGCATTKKPFVYAKLSSFDSWIDDMNSENNANDALAPVIPKNDAPESARAIKCPSKNSAMVTYNCYATSGNDPLGRSTSSGCHPVNGLDPTGSYKGVWFYIDIGPTINAGLQRKEIEVSTCFSTYDTVLRAFSSSSWYNLSAGAVPDIDDCADTSTLDGLPNETPDAMNDNRAPTDPTPVPLSDCGHTEISTLPKFVTTQSWETNGVRWYFLVTGRSSSETFESCGMTQLSCRLAAVGSPRPRSPRPPSPRPPSPSPAP